MAKRAGGRRAERCARVWMCVWMYTFVEETDDPLLEEHLRRVILLEKWNIAEFAYDAFVTRVHEPDRVNVTWHAAKKPRNDSAPGPVAHRMWYKKVYSSRWATRPLA